MSLLSFIFASSISYAAQLCGTEAQSTSVEQYRFSIVGNTRPIDVKSDTLTGKIGPSKGVTEALLKDIVRKDPSCVVLLGDMVKNGSKKEWKRFHKEQLSLLSKVPVQPVIGDYESVKDPKYTNTKIHFPDLGTDIGYNRVGSWSHFDIETKGIRWRILILDANKEALTSRWNEQLLWLDEVTKGDFDAALIFVHKPWYNLAGLSPKMNEGGAPEELISYVEGAMDLMKLRGVFFAGGHANQVILPNGPYGTAHIGAGGGGAPAEDLYQWQSGTEHGMVDKIELESKFVEVLRKGVDKEHGRNGLSQATMDKAFNTGTYDGFPGLFDGTQAPTQGWWELLLEGQSSRVIYHHHYSNGSIESVYELRYTEKRGWKGYAK